MKLWIGTETQADIVDVFQPVRKDLEAVINGDIEKQTYDIGVDAWDCIVILRDDSDFSEVIKFFKKKRDMDFRLVIRYSDFKIANEHQRRRLLFSLLLRSLDLLKDKGGNAQGIDLLKLKVMEIGQGKDWV
ncbi:MAG: Imm44 family immunity protein [Verrucomicrobiota bacterium]|nr:Imm44 family immunity protein [Verrucomicrobiota bacterium]